MDQETDALACPHCGTRVSTWQLMWHTKFRCEDCHANLRVTGLFREIIFREIMIYPLLIVAVLIAQDNLLLTILVLPTLYALLAYASVKLFYRLEAAKG